MSVDLHCHTTASDGTLTPRQLYQRAHAKGVEILAITDHDTIAGFSWLQQHLPTEGPRLVPGIELSTRWSGIEVHIVGLNFDTTHASVGHIVDIQSQARQARAKHIAGRLAKRLGSPWSSEGIIAEVLSLKKAAQRQNNDECYLRDDEHQLGRPHFARWLVKTGIINDASNAFKKYLGNNKLGNLCAFWPGMSEGVARIRALGGTAVLAHPGKYRMTRTRLRALITDFKYAGGHALEVSGGTTPHSQVQQLAGFCQEFGLKASQGSDFHTPDNPWIELGKMPPLPASTSPVWENW